MKIPRGETRRADAVYEAVAARNGGRSELDDVRAEMEATIAAADLAVLQDQYFWALTHGADERALRRGRSAQISLFSGQVEALDGYVALGGTARVKRRVMLNEDWVTHIQLMHDNVQDVSRRYQTELSDHSRLLPYLSRGMDTEQAMDAWRRDHPRAAGGLP